MINRRVSRKEKDIRSVLFRSPKDYEGTEGALRGWLQSSSMVEQQTLNLSVVGSSPTNIKNAKTPSVSGRKRLNTSLLRENEVTVKPARQIGFDVELHGELSGSSLFARQTVKEASSRLGMTVE